MRLGARLYSKNSKGIYRKTTNATHWYSGHGTCQRRSIEQVSLMSHLLIVKWVKECANQFRKYVEIYVSLRYVTNLTENNYLFSILIFWITKKSWFRKMSEPSTSEKIMYYLEFRTFEFWNQFSLQTRFSLSFPILCRKLFTNFSLGDKIMKRHSYTNSYKCLLFVCTILLT